RRRHAQAQAAGEAEGRQEADEAGRQRRHPAGSVPRRVADGQVIMQETRGFSMDFDFALLLVVLTAVSGIVWLLDRWLLAPRRNRRVQAIEAMTARSQDERDARVRDAARESTPADYARSSFPILLLTLLFRPFIA